MGISINIKPDIVIKPHFKNEANKYIKYPLKRLNKHRDNPELFWKIAGSWMKNSVALRVAGIKKVLPGWYKNLPFWTLFDINCKVSYIIDLEKDELIFKRVYIPKGDTHRPLGVPNK